MQAKQSTVRAEEGTAWVTVQRQEELRAHPRAAGGWRRVQELNRRATETGGCGGPEAGAISLCAVEKRAASDSTDLVLTRGLRQHLRTRVRGIPLETDEG